VFERIIESFWINARPKACASSVVLNRRLIPIDHEANVVNVLTTSILNLKNFLDGNIVNLSWIIMDIDVYAQAARKLWKNSLNLTTLTTMAIFIEETLGQHLIWHIG
jgi:hypothetical protein